MEDEKWIRVLASAVEQAVTDDEERLLAAGWTRHGKYWRHKDHTNTYSRDAAVHQLLFD